MRKEGVTRQTAEEARANPSELKSSYVSERNSKRLICIDLWSSVVRLLLRCLKGPIHDRIRPRF